MSEREDLQEEIKEKDRTIDKLEQTLTDLQQQTSEHKEKVSFLILDYIFYCFAYWLKLLRSKPFCKYSNISHW